MIPPGTRRRFASLAVLCVLGAACSGGPSAPTDPLRFSVIEGPGGPLSPVPGTPVAIEGEWRGTTAGGMSVSLTISPARRVTSVSVEYRDASCSGVNTFTDLDLPTANPYVGEPATPQINFESVASGTLPRTVVIGSFYTANSASGLFSVTGYPGCGSGLIGGAWTATR